MDSITAYTDILDIIMDNETDPVSTDDKAAADTMLSKSLNNFGRVDINYIAQGADISVEMAISALKSVIYQDPLYFEGRDYSIDAGWVLLHSLLGGNIKRKLAVCEELIEKYDGRNYLRRTAAALRNAIPPSVSIEEINVELGASWIPEEEYSLFLMELLDLRAPVKVEYLKATRKYTVEKTEEMEKSTKNTVTYGVSETKTQYGYKWKKVYLSAADIYEKLINNMPIKINDYEQHFVNNKMVTTAILNCEKTQEAQEKANIISEYFKEWVMKLPSRQKRFEDYYNEEFTKYATCHWDGRYLTLPDLNPNVKPYPNQLNGIAHVLLSFNNVLIAHEVGAGKSFVINISAHELHRLGLAKKILVVSPNANLDALAAMHRHLYKDDDIFVVSPTKEFSVKNRDKTLEKIKNGSQTVTYMAMSSFDMLTMGKDYWIRKMEKEIKDLRAEAFSADKTARLAFDKKIRSLEDRLKKYMKETPADKLPPFNSLGIDCLFIDEAHYYKNIPFSTRAENVVGLNINGSKKSLECLEKVHNVSRTVFLTGTPLTNSLADLYAFQMYLQPNVLKSHRIDSFDAWISTFGKKVTSLEPGVDANSGSLRPVERFVSFHNLGELMSMFSQVCDFYTIDKDSVKLPQYDGYTNITVPKTLVQSLYMEEIVRRCERIKSRMVSRTVDNFLKVTINGMMAALDTRLIDPDLKPEFGEKTKIDRCADEVKRIYDEYPGTAQVVFSDLGTPKNSFNVYDCLADTLVEKGIPREEIAFVHDATTDSARTKLFNDMNKGNIRVLIGSTQKLGVGVNIQERLIALHHLSVPFRPADMLQREGRLIRNGNTCPKVFVYRYITEGSFDAFMWQLLQNKAQFISAFMSGVAGARESEDISETVLDYAQAKALALGNPLVKTRVETAIALDRAKMNSRSRIKAIRTLSDIVKNAPKQIDELYALSEVCAKDFEHYRASKITVPNSERTAFGEDLIYALQNNGSFSKERLFEEYQGFSVMLPADMSEDNTYVNLRSKNGGCYYCKIETEKTALGCTKTIDYLLDHLDERSKKLIEEAENLQKQARAAEEDLAKGNPYLETVKDLSRELESIDLQLAGNSTGDNKKC